MKQTYTRLLDDLDRSDGDDVREVVITIDKQTWKIDLSEANRKALDEALAPFTKAGRKVARRGRQPKPDKA